MPGWSSARRQRSSAAIVMTRTDPPTEPRAAAPQPAAGSSERDWQWLWWIPLGLLVAAAWAALLLGDSLQPPP